MSTTPDPVKAFLDWLISMDEPDNAAGMEARRTVTLTEIIRRARLAKLWHDREEARAARSGISVTQNVGDVAPGSRIVGYSAR
jgi:hypothetical protein